MPDHPPVQASQPQAHVDPAPALLDPAVPGDRGAGLDSIVYDARALAELEAIFGRPKLMDLLGRLKVEITQRLHAPASERATLGRDAHTLLSVSGSLGFVDLSRRCAEMEQACLQGVDLAVPLEAARQAAAQAIAAIDRIVAGA